MEGRERRAEGGPARKISQEEVSPARANLTFALNGNRQGIPSPLRARGEKGRPRAPPRTKVQMPLTLKRHFLSRACEETTEGKL